MHVAKFDEAIYVLHCFAKKTQSDQASPTGQLPQCAVAP